jgi:ATP-dependent Clp protease adaptor protein ClpS
MSGTQEDDSATEVLTEEGRPKVAEPPKYAVVMHNDDYTTMDFVVEVLQRFFRRTPEEAMKIMLRIHHEGQGVAGIYSFDIAETKVAQVESFAQGKGFPLRCSIEPA